MSRNAAPRAPSTTRWSNVRLSCSIGRTAAAPSTGTMRSAMRPTARIPACGALTIASNESTPNIPRFEIVNVPPLTSAGRSSPARAAATSRLAPRRDLGEGQAVGVVDHRHDERLVGRRPRARR